MSPIKFVKNHPLPSALIALLAIIVMASACIVRDVAAPFSTPQSGSAQVVETSSGPWCFIFYTEKKDGSYAVEFSAFVDYYAYVISASASPTDGMVMSEASAHEGDYGMIIEEPGDYRAHMSPADGAGNKACEVEFTVE